MKAWKLLCILLFTLCLPLFSGCWNYREFDALNIVSAIAIDSGTQGYKYHITFEFLDESGQSPKARTLETEGDTIFDAARNAAAASQKKLYFSSCRTVIISQDLARHGIAPLFDFLLRDTEPRITLFPLISKEKTAGEILHQESSSAQLIGLELARVLESNAKNLAEAHTTQLFEAYGMLADRGMSLTLPYIKLQGSELGKIPTLDGTAVFKDDILIGFLSSQETKYFLYVRNQAKGGLLLTAIGGGTEKNIALEILGSNTTISPQMIGNAVGMQIDIKTKCDFGENQSTKALSNQGGILQAEKAAEKTLQDGISAVITRVQRDYKSDIFGFGKELHESMPDYWKKVKGDWNNEFPSMKFTVNTTINIQGTATAREDGEAGNQNG